MKIRSEEELAALAALKAELVKEEIRRCSEASSALTRWFIASLLLLHGAALVALMSLNQNTAELMFRVGWSFAAGLLIALGAGFLTSMGYAFAASYLFHRLWSGEILIEESYGKLFVKGKSSAVTLGAWGHLLALTSLAFFVFGCFDFANESFEILAADNPKVSQ